MSKPRKRRVILRSARFAIACGGICLLLSFPAQQADAATLDQPSPLGGLTGVAGSAVGTVTGGTSGVVNKAVNGAASGTESGTGTATGTVTGAVTAAASAVASAAASVEQVAPPVSAGQAAASAVGRAGRAVTAASAAAATAASAGQAAASVVGHVRKGILHLFSAVPDFLGVPGCGVSDPDGPGMRPIGLNEISFRSVARHRGLAYESKLLAVHRPLRIAVAVHRGHDETNCL